MGIRKRAACGLLAAGTAVSLLTGCNRLERYSTSFLGAFDTASMVVGYAESEETFESLTDRYEQLLMEYSRLYDIYEDYDGIANLKTVNDNAGIAPVEVDSRIIDLLNFGKEVYEMTDGLVNICFGSVLSVWHDYREAGLSNPGEAELPPMELLQEASEHTDIDNLIVDEEASTVYVADPEMSLDVGAIAKGYAVEQTCKQIEEEGLSNASFSIGGNIRALGWREGKEGENWVIGLEDPMNPSGDYLMTLGLHDTSMVTSGDYQRYYTVDGKNYHHIIDPNTLMPAENMHGVSVICEDSGMADALSTWLFLLPVEEGLQLVESMEGVEAVWVGLDGSQTESSGFAQYRND